MYILYDYSTYHITGIPLQSSPEHFWKVRDGRGNSPPRPERTGERKNSRVRTELFISAMYHYYSIKHTHP